MALTTDTLLASIGKRFSALDESVTHVWAHPFLRVVIRSPIFVGKDPDEREQAFAEALSIDAPQLRALSSRNFVRWDLTAPDELFTEVAPRGTGWLDVLDRTYPKRYGREPLSTKEPRYLHFYGFKGGQARSTVLALTAQNLADDGWHVLVVDFDAEAPSLELILGATTNDLGATVVGLRSSDTGRPVDIVRTPKGGSISLIPFRPDDQAFDFDAAALAFELQNYPLAAESLAASIGQISSTYDIVLVDHRTGLGPVVPTMVRALPGPAIVFARLDGQSRHARRAVAGLWSICASKGWSGVLASLSPADETPESFRERNRAEAEDLLQGLAEALGPGEDNEPPNAQDYYDNWIVLPFENSFTKQPRVTSVPIGAVTAQRLGDIRRLLGLGAVKAAAFAKSGAKDEGDLIVTQALRKLQSPNSPYTLIVGRKGTGKTRLVRTLAKDKLGEPLLVPSDLDSSLGGIRAGHLRLKTLIERFRARPATFWFALFTAALEGSVDSEELLDRAHAIGSDTDKILAQLLTAVSRCEKRRIFLVDGLESAFEHNDTFPFVRGLFALLESIDATPQFSAVAQLRLFVRRDLVDKGIQNREQLEAGRRIDLVWDVKSIFNFALSRIARSPWYRQHFPKVVAELDMDKILESQVEAPECERLMLNIFPSKLTYKNVSTGTFLRTYFSDDSEGETSFYPRVYTSFLELVAERSKDRLVNQRVDSNVIVQAHQEAAEQFLDEVSQEIAHAAGVEAPVLKRVFEQLDGKKTPFDVDELVTEVASGASLLEKTVRDVFNTMKQLGIFEDYPKRPNQLRPGRLFKTALKMRFFSGAG